MCWNFFGLAPALTLMTGFRSIGKNWTPMIPKKGWSLPHGRSDKHTHTNRQNPPVQQNCHNFWMMQFLYSLKFRMSKTRQHSLFYDWKLHFKTFWRFSAVKSLGGKGSINYILNQSVTTVFVEQLLASPGSNEFLF